MSEKLLRIGVLVSGRGSNLQAIIDACDQKQIQAQIAVVLSNKPEAYALERARKKGILTKVILREKSESRESYDRKLVTTLKENNVELVVLAGFMRILSPYFIREFHHKLINIHPSLLPAFPGLEAQKQALDYGVRLSGVTVHFADEGCDTGPIILQEAVPLKENDTVESLSARILEEEHKLLPKAIDLIAKNKVEIKGRKTLIKP